MSTTANALTNATNALTNTALASTTTRGAFELARSVAKSKGKAPEDRAHRVTAEAQVVDGQLILSIPLNADGIGGSKPSKGEAGAIGFMLNPIAFEVNDQFFSINPGWVTLKAL